MQKPGLFGMNGFMFLLLTCVTVIARAQQPGSLILLESENKKAFTVRLGDNFFASSGQGHLVLSQLKDSIYRLGIRSNNNMAEKVFPVTVRHKDQGFQLKGNETEWVLYNWQTKETIQPLKEKDSSRILNQGVKRENGFSILMAAVVNDTSVLYNTYTGSFEKDSSKAQSLKPKAESSILKDSVSSSAKLPPTANGQPPAANGQLPTANRQPSTVIAETAVVDKKARKDSLQAAKKTGDSLSLLAKNAKRDSLAAVKKTRDSLQTAQKLARKDSLLAVKKSRDSLAIAQKQAPRDTALAKTNPPAAVIPATAGNTPSSVNSHPSTSAGQPPTANGQRPAVKKANIKKLREVTLKVSRKLVYLDLGPGGVTDTITLFIYFETGDLAPAKQPPVANAADAKKPSKSDSTEILKQEAARNKLAQRASAAGCGQLATDADMLFLRSAILRANTEQAKISLAGSAFGQKCFAVDQVRVLAGLVVSDKGRYQMMEAARLHIADPEHFHELANMFTDKNFKRKFLAMAGKRT
jgi:Domain of unknown function (DUF4476)